MALSEAEVNCLKIVYKFYCMFWRFPMKLSCNKSTIILIFPNKPRWIPFLFVYAAMFIISISGGLVTVFHQYLTSRHTMGRMEQIILVLFACVFVVIPGCAVMALCNECRMNAFFMELFKLASNLKGKCVTYYKLHP